MVVARALVLTAALLSACDGSPRAPARTTNAFAATIAPLMHQVRIRRVSFAVMRDGTLTLGENLDEQHELASLTKPLVGLLAADLAAEGRLVLAGEVARRLAHTADRPDGRFLYDSAAFAELGPILERAGGESLASLLRTRVLARLGLTATSVPDEVSASRGARGTARDLVTLLGTLTPGMLDPSALAPPYARGWFIDDSFGTRVLWHHGQDPDASALLVWVPKHRAGLVLLADGEGLSAPFYLFTGQLRRSPFALEFLAHVGLPISACDRSIARAIASGAMPSLRAAVEVCPIAATERDPALLAVFARSGDPVLRERGARIGVELLAAEPEHPRVLLDLAVLELQAGRPNEGRALLDRLLALPLRHATALRETARELRAEL